MARQDLLNSRGAILMIHHSQADSDLFDRDADRSKIVRHGIVLVTVTGCASQW